MKQISTRLIPNDAKSRVGKSGLHLTLSSLFRRGKSKACYLHHLWMHDLFENSRRPEDRRTTVLYAQVTALASYVGFLDADGSKSSIHHAKGCLEILVHDTKVSSIYVKIAEVRLRPLL